MNDQDFLRDPSYHYAIKAPKWIETNDSIFFQNAIGKASIDTSSSPHSFSFKPHSPHLQKSATFVGSTTSIPYAKDALENAYLAALLNLLQEIPQCPLILQNVSKKPLVPKVVP